MLDGTVIWLFRFRPVRPAFDEILRTDLIPDLCAQPGLLGCWSARQGPDELGPRVVVSVWDGASSGGPTLDPPPTVRSALLDETTDWAQRAPSRPHLRHLPRPWGVEDPPPVSRSGPPRRARCLRAGDAVGLDADASGSGPTAICMAETGPDDFLTVSAWRDWRDIETSTGGDIRRPHATRHPDRLVDWDVSHFEIVGSA